MAGCSLLQTCNAITAAQRRERCREDRVDLAVRSVLRTVREDRTLFSVVHLNPGGAQGGGAKVPKNGFVAGLHELVHQLYATAFPQSYSSSELAKMLGGRDLGSFVTLCVLWAGRLVASATFKILGGHKTIEIVFLATCAEHRGMGLGRLLVSCAAQLTRSLGFEHIVTDAARYAMPFWTSQGLLGRGYTFTEPDTQFAATLPAFSTTYDRATVQLLHHKLRACAAGEAAAAAAGAVAGQQGQLLGGSGVGCSVGGGAWGGKGDGGRTKGRRKCVYLLPAAAAEAARRKLERRASPQLLPPKRSTADASFPLASDGAGCKLDALQRQCFSNGNESSGGGDTPPRPVRHEPVVLRSSPRSSLDATVRKLSGQPTKRAKLKR